MNILLVSEQIILLLIGILEVLIIFAILYLGYRNLKKLAIKRKAKYKDRDPLYWVYFYLMVFIGLTAYYHWGQIIPEEMHQP